MLDFATYITAQRQLISSKRQTHDQTVIDANSPFEYYPAGPAKCGALLIHGLLDSPFSLRDIGQALAAHGILSRAILLPGHGTIPEDLLRTKYQEWITAVEAGVASFAEEVEKLFIVGYSTGATLAIYEAFKNKNIAGIILLSPAVRIKVPVSLMVEWHRFKKWLTRKHVQWLMREQETDYAKYQSIPFNAIKQVSKLTHVIYGLERQHALATPILMVMSREDETISSYRAMCFFSRYKHEKSRLLLYTRQQYNGHDTRIETRFPVFPALHIQHYSHVSLPFAPHNLHYGEKGDAISTEAPGNCVYGAYNSFTQTWFDIGYKLGLTQKHRTLPYNPDFNYMADAIAKFIVAF